MNAVSTPSPDGAQRPDGTPAEQVVEQDFTAPDADLSPAPIDHDGSDDADGEKDVP